MDKPKINSYDWKELDEDRREQLRRRVEASIPPEVMDSAPKAGDQAPPEPSPG